MKKIILFAAATIALAACSNDDNYIDEPVAAQISATIGSGDLTRASETSWATGDEIGVTMIGRYFNMKYVTKGDGNFEGSSIYFKNKREEMGLTAYYPFAGTNGVSLNSIEASTSAEFQTAGKQPKIDFLFADEVKVSGENPKVKFKFSHKMSQLTFVFKSGSGAEANKIKSYTIEGLKLDGTFNTSDGVCAPKADAEAKSLNIDLSKVTSDAPLIVFPQSTPAKTVTMKITDSEGQQYTCSLDFKNNLIEAGNNYKWTITVNKTTVSVDESEILNWNTKESETGASSVLPQM